MNAQQLKNSILQMAVQGKLVPQDPNDEPASVLLERIQKEKEQLIKEGRIKKEKNPSYIFRGADNTPYEKIGNQEPVSIADEVPFEIPESWEWARWGSISESIQYGYNAPAQDSGRIKMVRISDIQDGQVIWDSVPYCNIPENEIDTYLLRKNDILFARTGGTVGKSYLVRDVPEEAIYAGYLIRTRYSTSLCPQYLKYFMESPLYWEQLKEGTTATAQPNCNGKTLGKMLIPIPPIEEQQRIVKKFEEIDPLLQQYGSAYDNSQKLNVVFPDQLKKSILQLAVQGKLVPQDPSDEPASVLLERIHAEKERLISEGKIKRDKIESIIFRRDNSHYEKSGKDEACIDDEIPFEIPHTWSWIRWGSLSESIQYGYNAPAQDSGRIKMVRISDIQDGQVIWDSVPYCNIPENDIDTYLLRKNDILFARTGGTVGKSYLVCDVPEEAIYAGYLIRTRYSASLCPQYLKYFMESPLYWEQLKEGTTATAQPNCNGKTLGKMLIPIPPKEEQHRIVAKIEELLPIINGL